MKKPFNETKIGKILTTPLIKGAVSLLPFSLGSIASNILDENATGSGTLDPKTMPVKLMKLVIYAVLVYLFMSGKISKEDAEQAKEFIIQ